MFGSGRYGRSEDARNNEPIVYDNGGQPPRRVLKSQQFPTGHELNSAAPAPLRRRAMHTSEPATPPASPYKKKVVAPPVVKTEAPPAVIVSEPTPIQEAAEVVAEAENDSYFMKAVAVREESYKILSELCPNMTEEDVRLYVSHLCKTELSKLDLKGGSPLGSDHLAAALAIRAELENERDERHARRRERELAFERDRRARAEAARQSESAGRALNAAELAGAVEQMRSRNTDTVTNRRPPTPPKSPSENKPKPVSRRARREVKAARHRATRAGHIPTEKLLKPSASMERAQQLMELRRNARNEVSFEYGAKVRLRRGSSLIQLNDNSDILHMCDVYDLIGRANEAQIKELMELL